MAVAPVPHPITIPQVAYLSNRALAVVEKNSANHFNLNQKLMHHKVFKCHTTSQRQGSCSFTMFLTKKIGGSCVGVVSVYKIALAYKFTGVKCK